MGDMCKVKVGEVTKEYEEGTSFFEIAKAHQSEYDSDIVLVLKNVKLCSD